MARLPGPDDGRSLEEELAAVLRRTREIYLEPMF